MNFAAGKNAEDEVIELFTQSGIRAEKTGTQLAEYDILFWLGKKKYQAEVKYDMMSEKTGNLAIEFWNCKQNKPSGISITTANLWIQCIRDGGNIVIFGVKTGVLKDYMDKVTPKRVVDVAGDKNASLKLYDCHTILNDIFERLDTVKKVDMEKTIKKILKG